MTGAERTRHRNTSANPLSRHPARTVAALLACVLLASCTNSKFLVGLFYERIDNKFIAMINEWTDLDSTQRAEIGAYIGTYHTWHRRTQLPLYADTIRDITTKLSNEDRTTPADIERWGETARQHFETARLCHPSLYALPLARTLSSEQISLARKKWLEERQESRERFGSRTREERIAFRVGKLDTWSGRLGLKLTKTQLALYESALRQQISLSRELRELSDEWNLRLFEIVVQTDSPDYEELMIAHLSDRFAMMERAYPDEFASNGRLWRDFTVEFEKTLSKKQRRDVTRWLNKFAATLDALSRDKPEWLPADDPAYGCVVKANGGTAGVLDTSSID